MFKQPHQSIKTQCLWLSQLLQFQTTNHDSSWQNILTNKQNRKRFSSFLFCPNYSKISLYQHHLTKSPSFLLIPSLIFHATNTVTRSLLSHVKKHPNGENRSMFVIHLSDQRFGSKHQLVHSTVLM